MFRASGSGWNRAVRAGTGSTGRGASSGSLSASPRRGNPALRVCRSDGTASPTVPSIPSVPSVDRLPPTCPDSPSRFTSTRCACLQDCPDPSPTCSFSRPVLSTRSERHAGGLLGTPARPGQPRVQGLGRQPARPRHDQATVHPSRLERLEPGTRHPPLSHHGIVTPQAQARGSVPSVTFDRQMRRHPPADHAEPGRTAPRFRHRRHRTRPWAIIGQVELFRRLFPMLRHRRALSSPPDLRLVGAAPRRAYRSNAALRGALPTIRAYRGRVTGRVTPSTVFLSPL